jgi:hypothetical protein
VIGGGWLVIRIVFINAFISQLEWHCLSVSMNDCAWATSGPRLWRCGQVPRVLLYPVCWSWDTLTWDWPRRTGCPGPVPAWPATWPLSLADLQALGQEADWFDHGRLGTLVDAVSLGALMARSTFYWVVWKCRSTRHRVDLQSWKNSRHLALTESKPPIASSPSPLLKPRFSDIARSFTFESIFFVASRFLWTAGGRSGRSRSCLWTQ